MPKNESNKKIIAKEQTSSGQARLEALGALISGISHEINTPMHYLGNNLTFFKHAFESLLELDEKYRLLLATVKKGETPSAQDWSELERIEAVAEPHYLKTEMQLALEQSLEGVAMVSKLVLALKDFSFPPLTDYSLIDINKCVDTVATIARHEWKRDSDLKFELSRDLPYLYGSRDEIHQILLNLLVNAAHAVSEKITAAGYDRGKIIISTRPLKDQIAIEVFNDGPPIAPEHLSKIFEPHFTTKEPGKGTGIGLSIVKRIVQEAYGGKISVSSDADNGTTFKVVLPHRIHED